MSPLAYTLSFSASASSAQIGETLRIATELGAISPGTKDREHFFVIDYMADFERFERLTSEWQNSGIVLLRPFGP